MEQNILQEIENIRNMQKERGIEIDFPSYLYVKRYGRECTKEMPQITESIGSREWFTYKVGSVKNKEKLLTNFMLELEKHAQIGRSYTGCVCIELMQGFEVQEELYDFLELLQQQNEQLHYIFAVNDRDAQKAEELLESYFFIRKVYANAYSVEELCEVLEETFHQCGFAMTAEAMNISRKYLWDMKWQPTDIVEMKIRNMAKKLVYDRLQKEETVEQWIQEGEICRLFCMKENQKQAKERTIGFHVQGGMQYE